MAYQLPIKTHSLSLNQRRLLKNRAEEITRLADEGNFIRISLLIADMSRIIEESTYGAECREKRTTGIIYRATEPSYCTHDFCGGLVLN